MPAVPVHVLQRTHDRQYGRFILQIGASRTNLSKGVLVCPLQVTLYVTSQRPCNASVQPMFLAEGQGRILHNSTTLNCEVYEVSAWQSVARMMQLLSKRSRFVILPMQLRCFKVPVWQPPCILIPVGYRLL